MREFVRSSALLLPLLLVGCLSVVTHHPGATGVLASDGEPVSGAAVWQTGDVGPGACAASEPAAQEFVARSDSSGRFESAYDQGWRLSGPLPLPHDLTRRWTLCVRPQAGPIHSATLRSLGRGVPPVARYGCELEDAGLACEWERPDPPAPLRW